MEKKFVSKSEKEFQQKRIELWSNLVVAYTASPINFTKKCSKWADDILEEFDKRFNPNEQ